MAGMTDPRIEQAKQLIQQKKRDAARELLVSYLKTNQHDTEALYLYAFVARSPEESKRVLRRVLEINPLNYQARAALNKIENRSIEQQVQPPPLPKVDWNRAGTQQRSGFSTYNLVAGIALGAIVFAFIWIIGTLVNQNEEDEAESRQEVASSMEESTPAASPTRNLSTPTRTNTPFPNELLADLEATWTPIATDTRRPTRTSAPTLTPLPTKTTVPTFTPTEPQIEAVPITLASASRIYNDYIELAAQASWVEDTDRLGSISKAITAIISSLETSDYNGVTLNLRNFFEDLLNLLRREKEFVDKRKTELELTFQVENTNDSAEKATLEAELADVQEDVEGLTLARLEQQEAVDLQFFEMISGATATASFREQIDELKTPSSTPIIIPTSVPTQGG